MAKPALITVTCPCCQAELHIDPVTHAVIRHHAHVKPPSGAHALYKSIQLGFILQAALIVS